MAPMVISTYVSSRNWCWAAPGRERICESSDRMPENSTAMTDRAVRSSIP